MRGIDVARAPRGDRERVAQRRDRAARHAHVGPRHAVVRMQRRFVEPFEVRAVQREVARGQAQRRASG
ncbi:hypothetical protein L0Z25_29365 (plasmid) [Burkholderia multivorans]|uniref:hypothetical protein n=1 Tax=Burkholderia cepacia complex TaxID=87882 RepID=UPI001F4B3D23|nr:MULTISPECIES: hypothetical protein [Burkholderia cepacia complex]MCO1362976.1 hypothetical protein [Burkholderia multivorans]MDC6086384.1 hypothetical protein [Burkholderia cenocepacia]